MASTSTLTPSEAAEDKGPAIIVAVCVVTALSTLFCAARVYTRGHILGRLHLDDWLIMLSVVMGWASAVFSVMAVKSGNGKHFALLTAEQKSGAILWTMVGFAPGVLSFGIPKLAVVALLVRLLNPGRVHRMLLWAMAWTCLLGLVGCVVILFDRCTPSRSMWDFNVPAESCFSMWVLIDFAIYAGTFSAFTDLYLAVYPAVVLFSLQMNLRKKLALSCALGIGSVATIVAIYKTTRLPGLASADFSYDTSDLVVWTSVEGATIIIASCIPVLQPFVDKVIKGRILSSVGATRRKYNNYGSGEDMQGPSAVSTFGGGSIEMSGGGWPRHKKRLARDPNGLTFLDDETRPGSEERILKAQNAEATVTDGVDSGTKECVEQGGRYIIRTDDVSVSYDQKTSTSAVKPVVIDKRWNGGAEDAV